MFESIKKSSTNNCLESYNRLIKDEKTYRERLTVDEFRMLVFKIAKGWSQDRNIFSKAVVIVQNI